MSEKIGHAMHAANTTSTLSYSTAGGTFIVGGLTANELVSIVGLLLAVATFVVNWVYKHKAYTLEKSRIERGEKP